MIFVQLKRVVTAVFARAVFLSDQWGVRAAHSRDAPDGTRPRRPPRKWLPRTLWASAFFIVGLLIRLYVLPKGFPLPVLDIAIIASFWLCGRGAGIYVLAASTLSMYALVTLPHYSLTPSIAKFAATASFLTFGSFLGFVIDRLRTAQLVQEDVYRKQAAILHSELFGICTARDRRIVWANRGMETMFGYGEGEMAGVPTRELHASEAAHRSLGEQAYQLIRIGGTYRGQAPMVRKDGQRLWAELSGISVDEAGEETLWLLADITARYEAEEALRKSQSFLERTASATGVGGWEYDLLTGAINWSDQTCLLHDMSPGTHPTLEEGLAFYTPEARPLIEQALRQAMVTGEPWDVELELISAKGRRFWARATGFVEFDGGAPVRMSGAFQDITEKRRVARAVAESEQRLRMALEAANIGIWDLDLLAEVSWFDQRAATLLGGDVPAEQPVWRRGPEFAAFKARLHPDCLPERARAIARFYSGQSDRLDHELRIRMDDGILRHVALRGMATEHDPASGRITRAVGIFLDLTRERAAAAEIARRETEARRHAALLQSIYATTHIGLCLVDRDLRVIEINELHARLLGRSVEQCLGRFRGELGSFHNAPIEQMLHDVIATGMPVEGFQWSTSGSDPDGAARDWMMSIYPVRDSDGHIAGAGKAVLEITATKRAEHEVRALNLRLEEALRSQHEKMIALRETNAALALAEEIGHIGHWRMTLPDFTLTWSAEIYRIVGRTPGDHTLSRDANLALYHPEDAAFARGQIDRAVEERKEFRFGARILRPSGEVRYIDCSGRIELGADDIPVATFGIFADVTERWQAEHALKDANARLETLARTDGLTGLVNRRRFDEAFEREWRVASRNDTPLSIVMIDIDRFKMFNDAYGHQAGDDCLRAVANAVALICRRPGDVAARYGGEELVLLLPMTKSEGARLVADQVRFAIEALGIRHDGNSACGSVVTASIGVATTLPARDAPLAERNGLLAAADKLLYEAKRSGRNRVVCCAEQFSPAEPVRAVLVSAIDC